MTLLSSWPFCTRPQTEEAPTQHFPGTYSIRLCPPSYLKRHNFIIWKTVITLDIREVSRSHVPKYPCGPEDENKCSTPKARGRAVRQQTAFPAEPQSTLSPPPPLTLPIQHPSSSRALPLLMGLSPSLGKALQLLSIISGRESTLRQEMFSQKLCDNVHSISPSRAGHSWTKALSCATISNRNLVVFIADCCQICASLFAP